MHYFLNVQINKLKKIKYCDNFFKKNIVIIFFKKLLNY